MAKATMTIRQSLNYQPQHTEWLAANQALFNRVVAFYFGCIQAHEGILDLTDKEALTALEKLTHATEMHGNADRNASLVVGQRLLARYQEPFKEKPQTADRCGGREEKSSGDVLSQDATSKSRLSTDCARQGDSTAQGDTLWMDEPPPSIPPQLRLFDE